MSINDGIEDIKDDIEDTVDKLREQRDELKVQIHLAGMEVRDEWEEVEKKWHEFTENFHVVVYDRIAHGILRHSAPRRYPRHHDCGGVSLGCQTRRIDYPHFRWRALGRIYCPHFKSYS